MTDLNYGSFENDYFVFDGEKATTGAANARTGIHSYFGTMIKFNSKAAAMEYVNTYRGYGICKAGTARTLRKYSFGQTLENYFEHLYYI